MRPGPVKSNETSHTDNIEPEEDEIWKNKWHEFLYVDMIYTWLPVIINVYALVINMSCITSTLMVIKILNNHTQTITIK